MGVISQTFIHIPHIVCDEDTRSCPHMKMDKRLLHKHIHTQNGRLLLQGQTH